MRRNGLAQLVTVGALLASWTTGAAALTAAEKCEAGKLTLAGEYGFCRLKAEATAVMIGGSADYWHCDLKYDTKWSSTEASGAGQCPSNGDKAGIQGFVTQHTDDVAAALAGGSLPDYRGDLARCNATLGACNAGYATCTSDLATCIASLAATRAPASGQMTAYGTGSDGDVQAGAALSYTDNGDGTITDNNTGLMWEKKSDDDSIHDWDNEYTWSETWGLPFAMNGTMVTTFLDTLNTAPCFAGHCDWRIPHSKELYSIVNLDQMGPSVSPAFNTVCVPTCSVLTCSCTQSSVYWSSSTTQSEPENAWIVGFVIGDVYEYFSKPFLGYVRAVRGGV